jgi:hypothetical protein
MKHYEKDVLPHAVYRFFSADDTLLYIGCSTNPFGGRLAHHGATRSWAKEIATVKVKWYPDWASGYKAEAAAILSENPKYNRATVAPDRIGTAVLRKAGAKRKGDGRYCPRCGRAKENPRPGKAYCNSCYQEYKRVRRLERLSKS